MEKGERLILPQSDDTLWQFAHDNALLVRGALIRALQLHEHDRQKAIDSVQEALGALERLRSRAPESSALLATVLFFGIELEVRLTNTISSEHLGFEHAVESEIERTKELIAAIKRHMDKD